MIARYAAADLVTEDDRARWRGLTSSLSAARPLREAWGEVGLGTGAAWGGAASGLLMAAGGFPVLAAVGCAAAAALTATVWAVRARSRHIGSAPR